MQVGPLAVRVEHIAAARGMVKPERRVGPSGAVLDKLVAAEPVRMVAPSLAVRMVG